MKLKKRKTTLQYRNCLEWRGIQQLLPKGSLSKLLLDTVSLFAAPSLSGGGENKLLPMFIHVRNARKTTETPECQPSKL